MTLLEPSILEEFFAEGNEHLDAMEACLLRLEAEPEDVEAIARAFRAAHTIKGAAGFLGLGAVERLMHAAEDLLEGFRSGASRIDTARADALLRASDRCRALLRSARDGEAADPGSVDDLVGALRAFGAPDAAPPPPAPGTPPPADEGPPPAADPTPASEAAPVDAPPPPRVTRAPRVPRAARARPPTAAEGSPAPSPPAPAVSASVEAASVEAASVAAGSDPASLPAPPVDPPPPVAVSPAPEESPRAAEAPAASDAGVGTIRVDLGLLDDIVNLVGELVVARNRLVQVAADRADGALAAACRQVDQLTSDLQGRVMKTRMRPVAVAWGAMPRLVRDVAAAAGKLVVVETEGQETELDRGLLEAIKDPLSHLIRNAVDHGIETPEARAAAGKPATGTIRLRARHGGGQVMIEVSDDGRGIDLDRVRARAVERGLLTADAAAHLDDDRCLQLIFLPGFSTAGAVSTLSGRGVGMDVVKRNVERVGGSVDVRSTPGSGTTIRLKLPLTLAIVPALITLVGDQRFCISQANLVEIVDLVTDEARRHVERVAGAPLLRLRGALLPLVPLAATLGLSADEALRGYVVVVDADDVRFGVVVDDLHHTEEVVVKAVGAAVKRVEVFSGATVLGDGSVALILDVAALARRGRVAARLAQVAEPPAAEEPSEEGEERTLLRMSVHSVGMVGVDVGRVLRIDERRALEFFAHGEDAVFRYRDRVVPLRRLTRGDTHWEQVVVCEHGELLVGLAVTEVLDVVTSRVRLTRGMGAAWAEGVGFVLGQPTALLDLGRLYAGGVP